MWLMSRPGISSGGVVFFEGKVLIVQYQEGGWTFPKGHIEVGEDPKQTAAREVLEETGVEAEVLEFICETHYTNSRGEERNVHWYAMRAESDDIALEDTFSDGGFFDLEEARSLLSFDQDADLLEEALEVMEDF
jgi:diadenosine hexaphosphate hydrolase (ATP-forming)